MPLVADRVKELSTTTGTGTLTLTGAPTGFQTFSGAFGNGVSVYYVIDAGAQWEIGIGTTGAGTLTRATVLQSTNSDALVDLAAGDKTVFCAYVADRAVTTSDAATLTNKTIDDYTNDIAANSTHFRIKANATLAKGDVVKADGFTPGEQAIQVIKVASSTDVALGIVEQALSTGDFGTAVVIGELFGVNTNGLAVGATIYSNGSGGFTTTQPSSGRFQALGWVVRANSSTGVIAVNIVNPQYVEASTNTASTLVLRDGSGNFAAGTITAALTGNASTATTLQTARNINGVSFNGSADITVTAAAGTLTGTTLNSTVVTSSLTSVGTLTNLTVTNTITGSVSGNAGTATTLANTRTLWGQNFNGGANVTGSLTSVGDITGTGAVTLTATGATLALAATGANVITASTNGTERARITAAGNFVIGNGDAVASPAAGVLRGTDGSGTDIAGAALTISGGRGTGSGAGGAITFNTSAAGASGTTLRTATERMRIDSAGDVFVGLSGTPAGAGTSARIAIKQVSASRTTGIAAYALGNENAIFIGHNGTIGAIEVSYATSGSFTPLTLYTSSTERLRVDTGGNIGIATTSPSYLLSLGGNAARTVGMERHTTSNTAGNNLTVLAGGATSGATDKNGGTLNLSAGTATGSGSSAIVLLTAVAGAAGTADRAPAERFRIDGETVTETISGTRYAIVSQADIGSAANEIPLNQYLGELAYLDNVFTPIQAGTGITAGTGTVYRAVMNTDGDFKTVQILIDLTGLNSGGTAGDIIGVNGTANPCHIGQLPSMTVLGGRMTCLEVPAGSDDDLDLYSATEGTGVEDQAVTALTETQLVDAGGAWTLGLQKVFLADPTSAAYLYLVGQETGNATYTAGRFLIEVFGV